MSGWGKIALGVAVMIALMKTKTTNTEGRTARIGKAIARAEGYGVPGAIPTLRNNPGNIKGADGVIRTYPSLQAGWDALYRQVRLMLTGQSLYYKPDMPITEVARIYTGESSYMNWAQNVSSFLGVSPYTAIGAV